MWYFEPVKDGLNLPVLCMFEGIFLLDTAHIMIGFLFQAGESVELATWMTASSKLTLHGSHAYFLSLTAEKLGAYF